VNRRTEDATAHERVGAAAAGVHLHELFTVTFRKLKAERKEAIDEYFAINFGANFGLKFGVKGKRLSDWLQIRALNDLIQPLFVLDLYDAIKLVDRVFLYFNLDQVTILEV
jgi:hypothetical protein